MESRPKDWGREWGAGQRRPVCQAHGLVDSCRKGQEDSRPDSISQSILGKSLRSGQQVPMVLMSVSPIHLEIQVKDCWDKGFKLACPVEQQKSIHVFVQSLLPLRVCLPTQRCTNEILEYIQLCTCLFYFFYSKLSWKSSQVIYTPSLLKALSCSTVWLPLSLSDPEILIWPCLGTFLVVTTWRERCY